MGAWFFPALGIERSFAPPPRCRRGSRRVPAPALKAALGAGSAGAVGWKAARLRELLGLAARHQHPTAQAGDRISGAPSYRSLPPRRRQEAKAGQYASSTRPAWRLTGASCRPARTSAAHRPHRADADRPPSPRIFAICGPVSQQNSSACVTRGGTIELACRRCWRWRSQHADGSLKLVKRRALAPRHANVVEEPGQHSLPGAAQVGPVAGAHQDRCAATFSGVSRRTGGDDDRDRPARRENNGAVGPAGSHAIGPPARYGIRSRPEKGDDPRAGRAAGTRQAGECTPEQRCWGSRSRIAPRHPGTLRGMGARQPATCWRPSPSNQSARCGP